MTELKVKSIIIWLLSFIIVCAISLGVFALNIGDFNIVFVAFISTVYLIYKTIKLNNESVKLEVDGFFYNNVFYKFTDILSISRLFEEKHLTKNYKFYILGNSSIYFIETKKMKIQILGKLFKNTDLFMIELAKKGGIGINSIG